MSKSENAEQNKIKKKKLRMNNMTSESKTQGLKKKLTKER